MFKYVSLPATGPIAFIILQPRWPPSFTIYTLTKNGAQIWGLWKEVVRRGFCLENAKNCQFNQCYWSKVYFVTYRWISQAKKKIFKEVKITPKKKVQKEMKKKYEWHLGKTEVQKSIIQGLLCIGKLIYWLVLLKVNWIYIFNVYDSCTLKKCCFPRHFC